MMWSAKIIPSCFVLAAALAWCGVAAAKTGLAPVVVEGTTDSRIAQRIENAVLRALARNGPNPPRPLEVAAALGLPSPADRPTVEQCVAAGKKLGLDVIAVIRVHLHEGTASVELRVVTVADGEERRYLAAADPRSVARGAVNLVAVAFAELRGWDTDHVDVEHALRRDLDAEHAEYAAAAYEPPLTFAEHLYLEAEKRERNGKAAAIIVPTIFTLTTAALVYAWIARPWEPDEDPNEDLHRPAPRGSHGRQRGRARARPRARATRPRPGPGRDGEAAPAGAEPARGAAARAGALRRPDRLSRRRRAGARPAVLGMGGRART